MIIPPTVFSGAPASPAGRDAGTTPDKPPGNGTAWLREMEKQAMTNWLSHEVLPAAAAPAVYARISPSALAPPGGAGATAGTAAASAGEHREAHRHEGLEAQDSGGHDEAPNGLYRNDVGNAANGAGSAAQGSRVEPGESGGTGTAAGLAAEPASARAYSGLEQLAATVPLRAAADPLREGLVAAVMARLQQDSAVGATPALQRDAGELKVRPADGANALARTAAPVLRLGPLAAAPGESPATAGKQDPSARANAPDADPAAQPPRRPAGVARGLQAEAAPLAPLRIHAVWSERAVRVWIGADQAAGLTGQQLAGAALDIRRLLREQGASLASLTYNGEALLSPDDSVALAPRALWQRGYNHN